MSKIFLVSQGIYSDYSIKGVYSTRELADRAAELYTDEWDNAEVEEYELDTLPKHQPGLLPFQVIIDKEGNCANQPERISADDDWRTESEYGSNAYEFHVWAKDVPHALKIANERRIILLSQNNGEWGPPPPEPLRTTFDVNTERERRAPGGDEIPF